MSKTSFFNSAVLKRNLTGYWPMWAVYLMVMLIAVPLTIYNRLQWNPENYLNHDLFSLGVTASLYTGIIFAIAAAMAVYSFMYTPRASNMTASLPIKRETIFLTGLLSLAIVVVCVHIITAVVTILVELAFGQQAILAILQWMAAGILETLFFVGLASFCAVLTGHILILPCIYAIFNFVVIALNILINAVFEAFLYGYSHSISELTVWFTPVLKLQRLVTEMDYTSSNSSVSYPGWMALLIYIVVAIILSVAALLIYRKRRMELASDVVAVKPLRPIARYCMGVAGSLTLGLLLYTIIFSNMSNISAVGMICCMIIGGFFGYFASEMLICKSFRVFKKWKGFAVFSVIIVAFILCLSFDVVGFEDRVPDSETVEHVSVSMMGDRYEGSNQGVIESVTSLHKELLTDRYRNSTSAATDTSYEYDFFAQVDIEYTLDNGSSLQRTYYTALPETALDMFNSTDMRLSRVSLPDSYSMNDISYPVVEYYQDDMWYTIELTPGQFLNLYNDCILPDVPESSLGDISGDNAIDLTVSASLPDNYYSLQITSDAARTLSYLETLGIDTSSLVSAYSGYYNTDAFVAEAVE